MRRPALICGGLLVAQTAFEAIRRAVVLPPQAHDAWPAGHVGTLGLLMLGVALIARFWIAERPAIRSACLAISAVVAVGSLHALACRFLGRPIFWETNVANWFPALGSLGRQISAPGAALLLISALAALVFTPPLLSRAWAVGTGLVCASIGVLMSFLTLVSLTAGNPMFAGEGLLPLTAPAALKVGLLNCGLLLHVFGEAWLRWLMGAGADEPNFPESRRERRLTLWVLVGLWTLISITGVFYLRHRTADQREGITGVLKAILSLQTEQVAQWRRERLGDASTLAQSPQLVRLAENAARGKATSAERLEFSRWLRAYAANYGYDRIEVYDARWRPLLAEPAEAKPAGPTRLERYRAAVETDAAVVDLPLFADESERVCWDVLAGLRGGPDGGRVGAVVLRSAPLERLAPTLSGWTGQFKTGEVNLWVTEGDEIKWVGGPDSAKAMLKERAHPFGYSVNFRASPLPIARFARGERGLIEANDFTGQPITGYGRFVEGSNWALTSRVLSSEIYAPLRQDSWQVAATSLGLLATIAVLTGWVARQRRRNLVQARLEAELAQRAASDRLGMVMRHARDVIVILDDKLRILDANPRATERYGWTLDELRGRSVKSFRTARSLADFERAAAGVLSPGGLLFEAEHRAKDGAVFPVEVSAQPVEIDGEPRVLAIVRDISERRKLELSIRENERLLTAMFDHAPVGVAHAALDGCFRRVNRRLCEMLGVDAVSFDGRDFKDFLSAGDYASKCAGMETLRSGASARFVLEMEFCRADGLRFWAQLSVAAVRDPGDGVSGYVMILEDVTERKQARETLLKFSAELEQRVASRTAELAAGKQVIESLLGALPDPMLVLAGDGRLVERRLPELAETSPLIAALIGAAPGATEIDAEFLEQLRRIEDEARRSGSGLVRELDVEHEGRALTLEVRASPLGGGRMLFLLRDITARRQVERDMSANLERERQLSEMKSRFVSVASHEFRTPIAAAAGSLELLERHAERLTVEKRAELLTRARRSLDRLTSIITDVLNLSRADAGRVTVRRITVDLARFVQDVLGEVELADRQRHAYVFECAGPAAAVPVDTNLLHHVLSNLLANASRYSPAGTRITVSLEVGERSFAVAVADEGIGVLEADRDKIFDPFVRGGNAGEIGGTGLGLNIVKRYTELMGGRVELLRPERGAAFRIEIPFVQPAA